VDFTFLFDKRVLMKYITTGMKFNIITRTLLPQSHLHTYTREPTTTQTK